LTATDPRTNDLELENLPAFAAFHFSSAMSSRRSQRAWKRRARSNGQATLGGSTSAASSRILYHGANGVTAKRWCSRE